MENQILNQMLEWAIANDTPTEDRPLPEMNYDKNGYTYYHQPVKDVNFFAEVDMWYDEEDNKFKVSVSPIIDGYCPGHGLCHFEKEFDTIEKMLEDLEYLQDIDPWDYEEFFDSEEDENEE